MVFKFWSKLIQFDVTFKVKTEDNTERSIYRTGVPAKYIIKLHNFTLFNDNNIHACGSNNNGRLHFQFDWPNLSIRYVLSLPNYINNSKSFLVEISQIKYIS